MIKELTFGLPLDEDLRLQAESMDGFIEFIDDEYFTVDIPSNDVNEFVYVKRNNGEKVILTYKNYIK